MNNTMLECFQRTLSNCKYYEEKSETKKLLNEIGVLRGISYCLDVVGIDTHTPELIHYIDLQNKLIKG